MEREHTLLKIVALVKKKRNDHRDDAIIKNKFLFLFIVLCLCKYVLSIFFLSFSTYFFIYYFLNKFLSAFPSLHFLCTLSLCLFDPPPSLPLFFLIINFAANHSLMSVDTHFKNGDPPLRLIHLFKLM